MVCRNSDATFQTATGLLCEIIVIPMTCHRKNKKRSWPRVLAATGPN